MRRKPKNLPPFKLARTLWLFFLTFAVLGLSCKKDDLDSKRKTIGNPEVYDNTYAELYDRIWNNNIKYRWDVAEIKKNIGMPAEKVKILDAGCGTGTHYRLLSKKYDILGLDISEDMIRHAQKKNPGGKFRIGDINNQSLFGPETFTHIISMFEASFYSEDLSRISENYNYWLKPHGLLMIETIDRDRVVEIEPKHYIDDAFTYRGWWNKPSTSNEVCFFEKIHFANGFLVNKKHILFLPPLEKIEKTIEHHGFALLSKKHTPFEQEILYVFQKII